MKLVDEIIKRLYEEKYRLQEMAKTKSDIVKILEDRKLNIYNHLVYCYLWTDTENYNHWKGEIRAFIYETYSIKGTNKFPTAKQLYKWCFEDWIIEVKRHIDVIVEEAYKKEQKSNKSLKLPKYDNNMMNYICEYIMWLCENIADGEILTTEQVSNEIDLLIEKYK